MKILMKRQRVIFKRGNRRNSSAIYLCLFPDLNNICLKFKKDKTDTEQKNNFKTFSTYAAILIYSKTYILS